MDNRNRFLLVYGSQTGQAKAIAEEIADLAPSHELKADLHCISETDYRFCIEYETCAVFVVSTCGDGEPPDLAHKLYRRLLRHTVREDFLKNLNYALLALGDSNFPKYALFGRFLEKRLKELQAKPFYATGFGDDSAGIETGVDPWIKNLWPALHKQLGLHIPLEIMDANAEHIEALNKLQNEFSNGTQITIKSLLEKLGNIKSDKLKVPKVPTPSFDVKLLDVTDKSVDFLPNESFVNTQVSEITKVQLTSARNLTSGIDVKEILELTFQFKDSVIDYVCGDSFGFISENPEKEVNLLLERLNILSSCNRSVEFIIPETSKRKLPGHLCQHLTLLDIFQKCIEIRSVPKKILFRILAEYTLDENERKAIIFLCSHEGSSAFTECVRKPSLSVLDILTHFPSCNPPFERIIEYLPPLKPRFYSVASSNLEDSSCFKIVFNFVEIPDFDGCLLNRKGVCTGFLSHLSTVLQHQSSAAASLDDTFKSLSLHHREPHLFVYKRKNLHFYLPDDVSTPIIMIGPGVGVAPFIGFLRHRKIQMKTSDCKESFGETWLFYGCRYKDKDYLYKDELQCLNSAGVLTHLVVSHSRDADATTRYVYEGIRQHGQPLTVAIHAGAKIYVCGDAKFMAHDVEQAFVDVFREHDGILEDEAKAFITKLQKQHQYLIDVW